MGSHAALGLGFEHSKGFLADRLTGCADAARVLIGTLDQAVRAALRLVDEAEKNPHARDDAPWPTREITRARKALEAARSAAVERLKQVRHFHRHATWLIERFPEARYRDVMGLCKAVTRAEVAAADWSLTPGRYVGVAAVAEDEDFDFLDAMSEIHEELAALNEHAHQLSVRIQSAAKALLR
jgi:type I restriction enzyme M protein